MIVAANAVDLYTSVTDATGRTTLSRISRDGGATLASQTWENRNIDVVQSDAAGHLVVTLVPPVFMDSDDSPQSSALGWNLSIDTVNLPG